MGYLFAFVGFAALIILHEFGHFAAAKAVGMRVERFSLFFGRAIVSRTRGETEYRIGMIPLGGYVKITGMNPYEELHPDVAHRAFLRQPTWKRVVVIGAGPFVNIVIFLVLVFGILWYQGIQHAAFSVDKVETNAAASGQLLPGDRVLSVDGIRAYSPNLTDEQFSARATRISKAVGRHQCAPPRTANCVATTAATVVVLRKAGGTVRDGEATSRPDQRVTLHIRPHLVTTPRPAHMLLGIQWGSETEPIGPGQAATESFTAGWRVTTSTVSTLGKIFTSSKARKQLNSAVGAYEVTRERLDTGVINGLETLALISLSLAIINLFPFLPLDGGHIAWALAEKIRGKAVPFRMIERFSAVGFVLIIFVFLIGLSNDIGRIQGAGFGVH
jgi:regulator of sigma E protease